METITQSGYTTTISANSHGTSAYDTYVSWVAELGLTLGEIDTSLSGDDLARMLPLASPALGTGDEFAFCTEGAIGIYRAPTSVTGQRQIYLPGVSRMYARNAPADLFFTFHPPLDGYSGECRAQRANGSTILTGRVSAPNGYPPRVDFAIRMDADGRIRFVLEVSGSDPIPFMFFYGQEGSALFTENINPGSAKLFDVNNPLGVVVSPEHRYWRATNLEAYGEGALEMSAFHLLAGATRVDAPATLTCNVAPTTGALAALQDTDLTTFARWPAAVVQSIALQWDFGVDGMALNDIRLAGDSEFRFPLICKLQWSEDAVAWTDYFLFAGISYPGPGALSESKIGGGSINPGATWDSVRLAPGASLDATGTTLTSTTSGTMSWGLGPRLEGVRQFEVICGGANNNPILGVADITVFRSSELGFGSGADKCWGFVPSQGVRVHNGSVLSYSPGLVFSDVIGVVVGVGTLTFYKNGVSLGVAFSNVTNDVVPAVSNNDGSSKTLLLRTSGFDFPIPGALPWAGVSGESAPGGIFLNKVKGRAAPKSVSVWGSGPVMVYGTPIVLQGFHLGIDTGEIEDYTSGVLGRGVGRVFGTVAEKGTPNAPVYRRVRLFRERDGLLMREQWSDKVTGAYDFRFVDEEQRYTVVSYDHQHNFRAVIADNVVPEVLP